MLHSTHSTFMVLLMFKLDCWIFKTFYWSLFLTLLLLLLLSLVTKGSFRTWEVLKEALTLHLHFCFVVCSKYIRLSNLSLQLTKKTVFVEKTPQTEVKIVRSEENIATVDVSAKYVPNFSIRHIQYVGFNSSTAWKILRKYLDLHLHKVQLSQKSSQMAI